MWKKGIVLAAGVFLLFSLITLWSVKNWSETEQGKLPLKTAVILHAINNNLVSLDVDMKVPEFLSPDESKDGNVTMKRDNSTIAAGENYEIPVRIYRYSNVKDAPVIVYYHGGAFLEGYGSLDTHDNVIRSIAARTGAVVISPGYRLAPEYTFPTAVQDSYKALQWAHEHAAEFGGNPEKIAVAGDSAGGNLAAVTALKTRDENGPDVFAQLLYYPLTTFEETSFESMTMYDSGYFLLSRQVMLEARKAYTPEENMWQNPYTSPLNARDLSNLPPAFIVTAEFDPLRDEGEQYGRKLHNAGNYVKTVRYKGVMHGFVSFFEIMERGNMALQAPVPFLQKAEKNELNHKDSYAVRVQSGPSGLARLKEQTEAFAIGAFLVGKSAVNRVIHQ